MSQNKVSSSPNSNSTDQIDTSECADHAIYILQKLRHFYKQKEFFDIILIAGIDGVKQHAHRIVLSAVSDYFLAMFRSTLEESEAKEITLENFDGTTLKLILNFIYTSKIELHSDIVENIVIAADFLHLNTLISACCDFMADQLDPSNCLGVALFAQQHFYTTLYEKAISYVYANFATVSTESEFLKLDNNQLSKILFSEDIGGNSQAQELVFNSLVAWVKHDLPNRQEYTYRLLSRVHFTQLEPKFLMENSDPICQTIECYQLVHRWLKWHFSPELRSQTPLKLKVEGRKNEKLAFATGTSDFQIQSYNSELNEWSYEKWPMPPRTRMEYGTILIEDKWIIAGGKLCGQITNTVDCLDLNTMKWCELPAMAVARRWPGMAELNGRLYVVGGESAGNWSCLVEMFDFSSRCWSYSEPLRVSLSFIQVAVISDKLYAVGNGQRTIECYDSVGVKWTSTTAKGENSLNFGMATVNGQLYAVGGDYNGVKCETVECYNPSTDGWRVGKSLTLGRLYVKCAALNGKLIACVGYNDVGEWVNLVEEYNPETDEWRVLAPLLPHDFCISSRLFVM